MIFSTLREWCAGRGLSIGALLAALIFAPSQSNAESYQITLNAELSSGQALINGVGMMTVIATFYANDATQLEFGDKNCDIYEGSDCVAYGYDAYDLTLKINDTEVSGWTFGVANQSFSTIPFNLKGKSFFAKSTLQSEGNFWLPLINRTDGLSTIVFGDLYKSIGGMAFGQNSIVAIDNFNRRAFGFSSSTASVSAVPEPNSSYLLLAGVITALLYFLRSVGFSRNSHK
jgi:hypothetical protein